VLVLSRRANESIIIDDRIEVKVLKIEGGTVKLGIVAPQEVKIYRKEIYEAVKADNVQATSATVEDARGLFKRSECFEDKDRR